VNVSKKTASLNPTQSHYDSFEIFWRFREDFLDDSSRVCGGCHFVVHGAKMQRLRVCDSLSAFAANGRRSRRLRCLKQKRADNGRPARL
jgi:hypothetical protein